MSTITNAEAALLGLLSEKERHPYDIEQQVKNRDMRYWTDLSMSSIYKLLAKLEQVGLVASTTTITAENRTRRIYNLTEDGEEVLRGKLRELLSEPEHLKWRLDIAISNLTLLPNSEIIELLHQYKTELDKLISGYKNLEQYLKDENCPTYRLALARRPQALLTGELKWVQQYLKELEDQD